MSVPSPVDERRNNEKAELDGSVFGECPLPIFDLPQICARSWQRWQVVCRVDRKGIHLPLCEPDLGAEERLRFT